MAVTLDDIETFLRQSVPRQIPKNIFKRLLSPASLIFPVVFGGMFFLLGSIFCAVFFPWRLPTEVVLDLGWGKQAEATVTEVQDTNMTVNQAKVRRVGYEFITDDDVKVDGHSFLTRNVPAQGALTTVFYLSGNPRANRLIGGRVNAFGYFGIFVAIFPIVGLGFLLGSLWYRRSKVRVLRFGEFAMATVQSIESTNVRVNNETRFKITLDVPSLGRQATVETYAYGADVNLARQRMSSGESIGVLYDPAKPSRLLVIDRLLTD
jgi:hypothetical protein